MICSQLSDVTLNSQTSSHIPPRKCMGGCDKEIQVGEEALLEKGFLDGKPVSSYTCLPCIEKWLEESGQMDNEEESDLET